LWLRGTKIVLYSPKSDRGRMDSKSQIFSEFTIRVVRVCGEARGQPRTQCHMEKTIANQEPRCLVIMATKSSFIDLQNGGVQLMVQHVQSIVIAMTSAIVLY